MNDRRRKSRHSENTASATIRNALDVAGRRHKPDYWILILAALLLTIGLVVVYSISPGLAASQNTSQSYFVTKQLIDVGLGLAAFTASAYLPARFWRAAVLPLALVALAASVIVMFMPVDALYQAHRWIRLGGISFQVAELIKLAVLIWAASFLAKQWRNGSLADSRSTLRPLLLVLAGAAFAVAILQSDLGSAAVIVAILGLMAFAAGIPLKRVLFIGAIVLTIGVLAVSTSSYRRERLSTFLNPEANCQDAGYQACQALISIGSGGLFGLGLGYSVQAYGYLPEASDDSIFAIMAEKFGFLGSVSIIFIYGWFITRLKRVIVRTDDHFNRLIVVGVLAWMSTQMIINIGAMLGLLPLKGITLPLISQGGTSLIFLTAALGIVFNISRYTSYNAAEPATNTITKNFSADNSLNRRRVRRAYNPALVTRPRT